jgi:hypothetical protein
MTPRPSLYRFAAPLLILAAAQLAACAAQFAVDRPEQGPLLTGAIRPEAPAPGPGYACSPMDVQVSVGFNPVEQVYPGGGQLPVGYLAGRAYTTNTRFLNAIERVVPAMQPYTIEGDIYENGTAVVALYQSTNIPSGSTEGVETKPFSVFRGTLINDRLEVVEQPPSCGRRLVAEIGGAGAASASSARSAQTEPGIFATR